MKELIDNNIVICPHEKRKYLLNKYRFLNVKYMTLLEFKEKYVFKYKPTTLYYLVKKYNFKVMFAKTIMNNLYYIRDINLKTKELIKIKENLIMNNYIVYNNNFRNYIKNKKIIVIGYDKTKENELLFSNLDVFYYHEDIYRKKVKIFKFNDIEDEIVFVATKIVELVNSGVNLNNIKIVRNEAIYDIVINKIFNLFNIPNNIKKTSLFSLTQVKKMIKEIDYNIYLKDFKNNLNKFQLSNEIYDEIIDIIDKYIELNIKLDDLKDIFIYELKNKYIIPKYKNVIEYINLEDINPNMYAFLIGFNQDVFPPIYLDNQYLTDEELSKLSIDTSIEKNKLIKNNILRFLFNDNIFITYKLKTPYNTYILSSVADLIEYKIIEDDYNYSNYNLNKILFAQQLDSFIKYNVKDNNIDDLYTNTEITYGSFDNTYKQIKIENLNNKLLNLNLSFSNLDTFYKCQFKFYIENILKINSFEETISIKVGNLFHNVLQEIYQSGSKNYETIIDNNINKMFPLKGTKQLFYNQKYKNTLIKLIDIINNMNSKSEYIAFYFEEWFSVLKDKDLNIKVVGKIDKIMTLSDETNTYVVVIDYKTGSLNYNFNKVIYGMDMQLLVYLYLIKNSNKIKNPVFTGMYLEPVLTEPLKNTISKTYDELLNSEYKLQGYTLKNTEILQKFDKDYMIDSFINGIKIKNDGNFYSYSKTLSSSEIENLIEIIDENIDKALIEIKNGNFKINPKKIGKNNVSCLYCKYKDLCYTSTADLVYLKEYSNLEFLGGEK